MVVLEACVSSSARPAYPAVGAASRLVSASAQPAGHAAGAPTAKAGAHALRAVLATAAGQMGPEAPAGAARYGQRGASAATVSPPSESGAAVTW